MADKLLIIAGVIWFIAGVNVFNIGIQAYLGFTEWDLLWLGIGIVLVFISFGMMFRNMVRKHTQRILGYGNQKKNVFNFFDARGYIIMGIMMLGGFGLRFLGLVPDIVLAFFYTGLGAALALAGVYFLVQYAKRPVRQTLSSIE